MKISYNFNPLYRYFTKQRRKSPRKEKWTRCLPSPLSTKTVQILLEKNGTFYSSDKADSLLGKPYRLLAGLLEIFSTANLQPVRPNFARQNPSMKSDICIPIKPTQHCVWEMNKLGQKMKILIPG